MRPRFRRGAAFLLFAIPCGKALHAEDSAPPRRPNVVFVMADDLGSAELSATGQHRFRTPNLDRFAARGLRFTQAYAPAPVCAPSRCSLMTGRDQGHAYIRDNKDDGTGHEMPLRASEFTVAESLRAAGYATACVGKWGLGGPATEGNPLDQGFDHFFGYLSQVHAHNHYTDHLSDDGKRIELDGKTYAPDLFLERALRFVEAERDRPFFLYYATTIPHLALQVPEESLAEFSDRFDETPYDGTQGYVPCSKPRAAYAAMVTRLDRDFGRLMQKLEELGLADHTLVVFTSDNGASFEAGGYDTKFFAGNAPLRGSKGTLYEGGIRVPSLVSLPGRIAPGTTSDFPIAHFDWFATLAAITNATPPAQSEGIDLSALLFEGLRPADRVLYFEHAAGGGWQAARDRNFKILRRFDPNDPQQDSLALYDLVSDPGESHDLAGEHPAELQRMLKLLERRTRPEISAWALRIDRD